MLKVRMGHVASGMENCWGRIMSCTLGALFSRLGNRSSMFTKTMVTSGCCKHINFTIGMATRFKWHPAARALPTKLTEKRQILTRGQGYPLCPGIKQPNTCFSPILRCLTPKIAFNLSPQTVDVISAYVFFLHLP